MKAKSGRNSQDKGTVQVEDNKYSKKMYHISVRSKISPRILHLDRTHKNFDNLENINNRRNICGLLRQDSELFKINPLTSAGAAGVGNDAE